MAGKSIEKDRKSRKMHKHQLLGMSDNLSSVVEKLDWQPDKTDWVEYETFHNYTDSAREHKTSLVEQSLDQTDSKTVWDLGANTGYFSRIASGKEINTIAFDIDPGAVELNYLRATEENDQHLLPLVLDLSNPSPDLGWSLVERDSLLKRGPADTVMALALIHHLAIGNNVPLPQLAEFFARICSWLIIEFVPKSDPQVGRLLQVREDIFTDYNQATFLTAFGAHFDLISDEVISNSERSLYLYKRN